MLSEYEPAAFDVTRAAERELGALWEMFLSRGFTGALNMPSVSEMWGDSNSSAGGAAEDRTAEWLNETEAT